MGDYASWLNGKTEHTNETLKNATHATLLRAGKEKKYWCYAYTDVVQNYNCILHSATGKYPDFEWYHIRPSNWQLVPWGCVIYLHTNNKSLDDISAEGNYFGATNSDDLSTKQVQHCTMACIDEFPTHVGSDDPMPGVLSIGGTAIKA
eukprot:6514664-Ditylum_brightwellii.AAC.1